MRLGVGQVNPANWPATPRMCPGAPFDPTQLALREMVANEIKAETDNGSVSWEYRQTTMWNGAKSKVEEVVETTNGNLARVLARDGHALTQRESQAEEARVRHLASNSGEWQKSQKEVQEDTKKANEFLRILPEVFDFSYVGEKDGIVDLLATPNPAFPSFAPRNRSVSPHDRTHLG